MVVTANEWNILLLCMSILWLLIFFVFLGPCLMLKSSIQAKWTRDTRDMNQGGSIQQRQWHRRSSHPLPEIVEHLIWKKGINTPCKFINCDESKQIETNVESDCFQWLYCTYYNVLCILHFAIIANKLCNRNYYIFITNPHIQQLHQMHCADNCNWSTWTPHININYYKT